MCWLREVLGEMLRERSSVVQHLQQGEPLHEVQQLWVLTEVKLFIIYSGGGNGKILERVGLDSRETGEMASAA